MASNFQKAERERDARLKARREQMYGVIVQLVEGADAAARLGTITANRLIGAIAVGRKLLGEIGPPPSPSEHGHKGVRQPVTSVTPVQSDTREFRGEPVQYRWLTLKCGHLRRVTGLNSAHAKVGDKYRCRECKA